MKFILSIIISILTISLISSLHLKKKRRVLSQSRRAMLKTLFTQQDYGKSKAKEVMSHIKNNDESKFIKSIEEAICSDAQTEGNCKSFKQTIGVSFYRLKEFNKHSNDLVSKIYFLKANIVRMPNKVSSLIYAFTVPTLYGSDDSQYIQPTPLLKVCVPTNPYDHSWITFDCIFKPCAQNSQTPEKCESMDELGEEKVQGMPKETIVVDGN